MEMLWAIIGWCLFGIVAGFIARFLVPGKQTMSLLATMSLGIVGSLVGGFLGYLLMGNGDPLQGSGWIMSILGGVIVLGIFVALSRRDRPTGDLR